MHGLALEVGSTLRQEEILGHLKLGFREPGLAPIIINGGIVEAGSIADSESHQPLHFSYFSVLQSSQAKEYTFQMKSLWQKSAVKLSAWEGLTFFRF